MTHPHPTTAPIHHTTHGHITLYHGDCLDVLRELPDNSVDAVVTDPPYGLEFMGKDWDSFGRRQNHPLDPSMEMTKDSSPEARAADNPWQKEASGYGAPKKNARCRKCSRQKFSSNSCKCAEPDWDTRTREYAQAFEDWCYEWAVEARRVLKPGGHMLAFGGTRTWHRLACAVEDAGFEVRDSVAWMYGQGFPKSLDVSAALDAARCRCDMREWTHGTGDPQTQHGLRDVPDADVPEALRVGGGEGSVLLPSMPESSAPAAGRPELRPAEAGTSEPRLEGRGDLPQGEGQLRRPAVRPMPTGVPADGTQGRLHHGAPARDGSVDRSDADPDGVREPQEPRPAGQPAGEPGALPDERRSQAWGGWPVCERCSQPVIPDGLGTAAKPAFEPIVVARKPLAGTVAANVLAHGTGALNIDGCRTATSEADKAAINAKHAGMNLAEYDRKPGDSLNLSTNPIPLTGAKAHDLGRWPANVILDESQAAALDEQSGETAGAVSNGRRGVQGVYEDGIGSAEQSPGYADLGGASRFFYVAKADSSERVRVNGTAHPTVKPLALMRWLVRLVTPPGGTVLEPFAGSGTTVEACLLEGFRCIAIEREADYLPLIEARIARRRDPVKAVHLAGEDGGLFDLLDGGAA